MHSLLVANFNYKVLKMHGKPKSLSAPLASIEDISKVNTPCDSPSRKVVMNYPVLDGFKYSPHDEDSDEEQPFKHRELNPFQPAEVKIPPDR